MSGTGFGNDLTLDEVIARKEGLIDVMMTERGIEPAVWDDVKQEARIALWQATERPHDGDAYLHGAARLRIREVRDRETWTGHTRQRGGAGTGIDYQRRVDSLDRLLDVGLILVADEILDRVVEAYHHGEILRAITDLEPRQRQYVILRFWGGLLEAEIASAVHASVATVQRDWTAARASLRVSLQHLAAR